MKALLKQLLEVLAYVHDNKYVHRDIKCSNLLIDNHLRLKVRGGIVSTVYLWLTRKRLFIKRAIPFDFAINTFSTYSYDYPKES